MSHEKLVLRAWVWCVLGFIVLAGVSYGAVKLFTSSAPRSTVSAEQTTTPATPTGVEGVAPYSYRVCQLFNGTYLNNAEERKALDSRAWGFYQGVKQEDGVLADFLRQLHDPATRIGFLNELLTTDVAEACGQ